MTRTLQKQGARAVALTRRDVENILVGQMGWEYIDAESFWHLARREDREPGYLEQYLREQREKAFAAVDRGLDGAT
jgi:hypothetical protein